VQCTNNATNMDVEELRSPSGKEASLHRLLQ